MDFFIKFDTVKSEWFIVYIEGSKVIISFKKCNFFPRSHFVSANSADPDEMPHSVSFHLGLHSFCKCSCLLVSSLQRDNYLYTVTLQSLSLRICQTKFEIQLTQAINTVLRNKEYLTKKAV